MIPHTIYKALDLVRVPFKEDSPRPKKTSPSAYGLTDEKFGAKAVSAPGWNGGPVYSLHQSKDTTSSYWSRDFDTILVNDSDHTKAINDSPGYPTSTSKANVLYQADPFSYASANPAYNASNERFTEHRNLMNEKLPGSFFRKRIDVIDDVRQKGREVIAAIEGGHLDTDVLAVSSTATGVMVGAATHTTGMIALAAAGHVAAAAAGAPVYLAGLGLSQAVNYLVRANRLIDVLAGISTLRQRIISVVPHAEMFRNHSLDHMGSVLSSSTREGIVENWDKTDNLLMRYLTTLQRVGSGPGSVAKKLADSNTTLVSHELKYSILAETRYLKQIP